MNEKLIKETLELVSTIETSYIPKSLSVQATKMFEEKYARLQEMPDGEEKDALIKEGCDLVKSLVKASKTNKDLVASLNVEANDEVEEVEEAGMEEDIKEVEEVIDEEPADVKEETQEDLSEESLEAEEAPEGEDASDMVISEEELDQVQVEIDTLLSELESSEEDKVEPIPEVETDDIKMGEESEATYDDITPDMEQESMDELDKMDESLSEEESSVEEDTAPVEEVVDESVNEDIADVPVEEQEVDALEETASMEAEEEIKDTDEILEDSEFDFVSSLDSAIDEMLKDM